MEFIETKHLLSSWSDGNGWFGTNYNMNIYKGCCHGCIYCDSRSECYHVENFDEVRVKENALLILDQELRHKRKKGIVGTGAMSDPYNPFEQQYMLTRGALEIIGRYGYGIGLLTKSDLAIRDIDLFVKIKEYSPSMLNFTITTHDDKLCKKIEPNVALSSRRFKALRQVAQAGIYTGILIGPILPFINDNVENIKLLTEEAAESGAKFVHPFFGVTLRQNQRIYFYHQLDKIFPGIKQQYISTFGEKYECFSPNSKNLWKVFKNQCEKYGLAYKMSDIISALKYPYVNRQISLF